MASHYGHETVVRALLAKGAKVNLQENDGKTALDYAKTQKIHELLQAASTKE